MADQQPTQTTNAAPPTAPNGSSTQQQNKARSTRAERRERNTEKRGVKNHTRNSRVSKPAHRQKQHEDEIKASIDQVINYLCRIRNSGNYDEKKTLLDRFTSADAKPAAAEKKKKEPSPEKLEKIAKRKELRAEKRKAKFAAREQQNAEGAPVSETLVAETAATQVEQKEETTTTEVHPDDALAFDELDYEE
ncbi:hypothetical protein P154DRAFT_565144 [Amniculicola lignicola CBS 123094]|uniref:Uncharacterized protein n=1 Tax=Amniculicola lignicola CBS 123094 TaxID=1392246 RepID=A0A6A5WJG0_9PLEO|nr:hypothetical protein P154DRAFT_565144 [Amniculicola lignicola CBS 123094]